MQLILMSLKVFLVMSSAVLFLSTHNAVLAASLMGKESEVINFTNQIRQAQGIPALVVSSELTASAQAKAQDMAEHGYFGHTDQYGNRMTYWIGAAGYSYLRAGENLAKGFVNSKDLIQAWVNSPTHYANLINFNYREIGIGVAEGYIEGRLTTFIVQHLGEPMPMVKIFPIEVSQFTNLTPQVLGDNLNSNPVINTTSEAMTEISPSGATAINKSPAGLLWIAYQEARDIMQQPIIPVVMAADVNIGLPDRGYQVAQILFVVLVFLGFWGWLSILMWPVYNWLGRLRNKT